MTEEHIKGKIVAYKSILDAIEEGYSIDEIELMLEEFIEVLEFELEE